MSRGSHTGTYEVRGSLVTINAGVLGRKSAELGRLPPQVIAGLLLRELIVESERRGRSAVLR